MWAFSSVGQSSRLITDRSGVQVPEGPPFTIKGYSSVGRAVVSKTTCRGFKSFCPCQKTLLSSNSKVFLLLVGLCANCRAWARAWAIESFYRISHISEFCLYTPAARFTCQAQNISDGEKISSMRFPAINFGFSSVSR
jgi:hypothetical protein